MGEVEIGAAERLFVPHRKRLSHTCTVNSDGARELCIDCGVKEIRFDDARLFASGEHICREPSFSGEDAIAWARLAQKSDERMARSYAFGGSVAANSSAHVARCYLTHRQELTL